jgi:AraC-like DNA-binding protein
MTDVLSQVLSAVRFEGSLYFKVQASAPWVLNNPSMAEIGGIVMPQSAHVIPFHVMLSGSAWTWPEDNSTEPFEFASGDILILPNGVRHLIASTKSPANIPPVDSRPHHVAAKRRQAISPVEVGEDGPTSTFICGYLGCNDFPFNPLLNALPPMLTVQPAERQKDLIFSLVQAALEECESRHAGGITIMSKLSELLFVEALRRYIELLPEDETGWLAGVRDMRVGRVLQLIHQEPAKDWTLAALANSAGMSRTVLAERFLAFTGESPGGYISRWRMQLACRLLENSRTTISDVAEAVGYKSEAAFKRTFKKIVGAPPGQWRRTNRA